MDQETRWHKRYQEVVDFIEANHRNPSKYVDEERGLVNWMKQQRKLVNAGERYTFTLSFTSLNRSFLMSYPFNPLNPCSFIIFLWGKSKKDQEMFRNLETNY